MDDKMHHFFITDEKILNNTAIKIINSFYQRVMSGDFKKLTVSEICKEAQVSRKTFYKYFKDKNDIVEQILTNVRKKSPILKEREGCSPGSRWEMNGG